MKRLLASIALVLCACTALADDAYIDGIDYNFNGGTAEVTFSPKYNYSGAVTIPASITYNGTTYSVTSIGVWAFNGYCSLTQST